MSEKRDRWRIEDLGAQLPTGIDLKDTVDILGHEMLLYEAALEIVLTKLRILCNEFRHGADRSPIDNIQSRMKTPQSIIDKIRRRGISYSLEEVEAQIRDIAGVRIVCPFISDVYMVADILAHQDGLHPVLTKDYISAPKPSGYRSLHMIMNVDVHLSAQTRQVPVEIQLRTIAMNCWASAEHQLRYKKDFELPADVTASLRECAEMMSEVDRKVQALAGQVLHLEENVPTALDDVPQKLQKKT